MSKAYHSELLKLSRTKKIISLLPSRIRYRMAKALYNYESGSIHGIDLVSPLQNDGLVCFINTKDIIGWNIFFWGEYEVSTNKVLAKYINSGDVVIEAGANMGSETLLMSKLAGNGCVYAFEPNPYTFKRLEFNIYINELNNIKAYELALGESDTTISFNIFPKNFCNQGMSSKYLETSNTRKITVGQVKIDTFIKENNIAKLDFLKLDIQGAEMDLLNGAHDALSDFKPKIFIEAYNDYNDIKALFHKIDGYGYDIYLIGKELRLLPSVNDVAEGNWIAIPKK